MNNILFSTNTQKILDFLSADPGKQFVANEIQKATSASRAGVNVALRQLAIEKIVLREKKANIYLYCVEPGNPVIKQQKILRCTASLTSLVNKIKPCTEKVVLFGSCSRGENTPRSDIDILVISNEPENVKETISKVKKVQMVIKTPVQYAELKKNDPVFYEEIIRGIVLWEKRE